MDWPADLGVRVQTSPERVRPQLRAWLSPAFRGLRFLSTERMTKRLPTTSTSAVAMGPADSAGATQGSRGSWRATRSRPAVPPRSSWQGSRSRASGALCRPQCCPQCQPLCHGARSAAGRSRAPSLSRPAPGEGGGQWGGTWRRELISLGRGRRKRRNRREEGLESRRCQKQEVHG